MANKQTFPDRMKALRLVEVGSRGNFNCYDAADGRSTIKTINYKQTYQSLLRVRGSYSYASLRLAFVTLTTKFSKEHTRLNYLIRAPMSLSESLPVWGPVWWAGTSETESEHICSGSHAAPATTANGMPRATTESLVPGTARTKSWVAFLERTVDLPNTWSLAMMQS